MEKHEVEKWTWTENDFDQMGWHDVTVYGVRLNRNLKIDLDYIFQWNQPEVEGFQCTFCVGPCTLVFESPTELSFELTQSFDGKWLEIQDRIREEGCAFLYREVRSNLTLNLCG